MKTKKILIIAIVVVLIALIAYATYLLKSNPVSDVTLCQELGCFSDTVYVGSTGSDKYYSCDCRYAKQIKPENIACFASDSEALAKNYIKVDC